MKGPPVCCRFVIGDVLRKTMKGEWESFAKSIFQKTGGGEISPSFPALI